MTEKKTQYYLADIDTLIPYARNSRTHTDEQVAQVAASIKEFGFLNPVIIAEDNTILAGHARVLAARKLGLDKIPCIKAENLTEAQKRAYIIADNKLSLNAGWDEDLLAVEISDLKAESFDLSLLGFDDDVPDRYSSGWLKENRVDLLVSRGVGTSVWPGRLFCFPQIHYSTVTY